MHRRCVVFDDVLSIVHFIVGLVLAAAAPAWLNVLAFLIYVGYEVVEGRYARDCPGADILEYLSGTGLGFLVKCILSVML